MTNTDVRSRIQNVIGVHGDLVTMAKKTTKLRWYLNISRSSGNLQRTVNGPRKRRQYPIIYKGRLGFSSVNFSSLNLIKMNLINFTGLSKCFSYFWMRKQVSRNYLRCVIDRTMRDGHYKCHHVSINLVDIFIFPSLK